MDKLVAKWNCIECVANNLLLSIYTSLLVHKALDFYFVFEV
ncbi:hypothetical protein BXY64_2705 [Marinifilum flexuosum]|uniref:Uncharacterized protein n=1 Tax=Marinifilum flexuosum TaxID=1117708 RepID=A0A419X4S6_9BACT|nr:hypothetical protein BXY64_2705 [Marinifilum flexuosum]